MKLLNLCCGAVRPQGEQWTNADNLYATLLPGTAERENLDREANYINVDLMKQAVPGPPDYYDGIVASHCFEHWPLQDAIRIMRECRTVLKPGGVLLVSVPDASVFRRNWLHDTVDRAQELYGEPIHLPDGESTFMGYAGFNKYHATLLAEDSLWCYFVHAGFSLPFRLSDTIDPPYISVYDFPGLATMISILNRLKFSLVLASQKP